MHIEKMSRRKQANPKSIKTVEEGVEETIGTAVVDESTMLVDSEAQYSRRDADDYDEFAPLVIDTAPTDELSEPSDLDTRVIPVADSPPKLSCDEGTSEWLSPRFVISDNSPRSVDTNDDGSMIGTGESPGERTREVMTKENTRLSSPSKTRRKSDKIQPLLVEAGREQYQCPVCGEVLGGIHQLTRHIRSHNTTTSAVTANSCTICGKALSSQSSLDRHMLVHSGERPFRCRVCNMAFTTNGNMHRHMRIHAKEATRVTSAAPSASSDSTKATVNLVSRIRSKRKNPDHDVGLTASQPDSVFPSPYTPLSVAKTPVAMVTIKKECHEDASTAGSMTSTYNNSWQTERSPFRTLLQTFQSKESPLIECKTESSIAKNLTPDMSLSTVKAEVDLNNKETTPEKWIVAGGGDEVVWMVRGGGEKVGTRCTACSLTFLCDYSLDEHLKHSHSHQMVACGVCSERFRSVQLLQRHSACHRPVKQLDASTSDPVENASLQALGFAEFSSSNFMLVARAWCERKLASSGSTATGQQVACGRCALVFPHVAARDMHAQACGTGDDACRLCDVSFATNEALRSHKLMHHADTVRAKFAKLDYTDDNDIRDVVDSTDFMLVLGLRRHGDEMLAVKSEPQKMLSNTSSTSSSLMNGSTTPKALVHSGGSVIQTTEISQRVENGMARDVSGETSIFNCQFCDETFSNLRALKGHARAHMGNAPYRCTLCSYASADRSTLARHERTHNGERPFQCRTCLFAFTTKANCERHVRKKHGCLTKEEIDRAIGYNPLMAESLVSDGSTNTASANETVCKYCGRDFEFARALQHHLRSHTSCGGKPYVCVPCGHGFSTRANCTRHMQRQHANLEPHMKRAPLPRTSAGYTYITSPPTVKPEPIDFESDEDEPLDFSMKSGGLADAVVDRGRYRYDSSDDDGSADVPMDLSVPKRDDNETAGQASAASSLLTHVRSHSNELPFRCHCCQIGFSVKANLERHLKTKHAQHTVDPTVASSTVSRTSSLGSDCELSSVTRILDVTDAARLLPAAFFCSSEDEQSSASSVPGDAATTTAVVLGAEVVARQKRPIATVTPSKEGSTDDEPVKRKRNSYADSPHKLQCPYCPRAFPWVSSLKRHILTHTGQKPYKCPQCPVTFSTKSNRERHMVRKHGLDIHDAATRQMMDRPYKCHICIFSSFAAAGNLLKHYHEKHPGSNIPEELVAATTTTTASSPLVVNTNAAIALQLDDSASSVSELSDGHQSTSLHEPEDEETVPSTMVEGLGGKLLESALNAAGTNESANHEAESKRECWQCTEQCDSSNELLQHIKEVHSGPTGTIPGVATGPGGPFKCYLCDAAFATRLQCLQHKMASHVSEWAQLTKKNGIGSGADFEHFIAMTNQLAEDNANKSCAAVGGKEADGAVECDYAQRKVHCSLCAKRFWSLQDLRRHMRSHTGERPFECGLCQKRFTLKHSMMRHQRRHTAAGCISGSDDESVVGKNEIACTEQEDQSFTGHLQQQASPSTHNELPTGVNIKQEVDTNEEHRSEASDNIPSEKLHELLARPNRIASLKQRTKISSFTSRPCTVTASRNGHTAEVTANSSLLPKLLGVENSTIEKMLDSVDNAISLLGVQ